MLKHFLPSEFQGQYDLVDVRVLLQLDQFREEWGQPVRISPADGAVARHDGQGGKSQHNVDRWGKTRAIDIMPSGLVTRDDYERAIDLARAVGFTGIGVYPHWRPRPGLHLDVRDDRTPANPALWGAVRNEQGRQVYVAAAVALDSGFA